MQKSPGRPISRLLQPTQLHLRIWPPTASSYVYNYQPGMELLSLVPSPRPCKEQLCEGQECLLVGWKYQPGSCSLLCWLRLILAREQDQGKKTCHHHGCLSSLCLCSGISSAAATTLLAQESSSKDWRRKVLGGLVFWVDS